MPDAPPVIKAFLPLSENICALFFLLACKVVKLINARQVEWVLFRHRDFAKLYDIAERVRAIDRIDSVTDINRFPKAFTTKPQQALVFCRQSST